MRLRDLRGQSFGDLTVIDGREPERKGKNRAIHWWCRCKCGSETLVDAQNLKKAKFCGTCATKAASDWLRTPEMQKMSHEASQQAITTHGMTDSITYRSWAAMKRRCLNSTHKNFEDYGGRGITVCVGMLDFVDFFAVMGECPEGLTLHRVDNDLGYWCGACGECKKLGRQPNCKWATHKEQARCRRGNRLLTHDGRTMTVVEWAEEVCVGLGISYAALRARIHDGWPTSLALTLPYGSKRPHRLTP